MSTAFHLARTFTAVVTTVAVMSMLPATAAEPQRGAMAACAADLAKFCQGTEAGGGKRIACLAANQAALTPACAETVQTRQARVGRGSTVAQAQPQAQPQPQAPAQTPPPAAMPAPPAAASTPPTAAAPPVTPAARGNMRACRTDLATHCANVQAGGGRKIQCLNENRAKLSAECSASISTMQTMKQNARVACEADAAKLCAGAKGPARMQCLTSNQAQLSPACADVMSRRVAKAAKRAAAPKQ